MTRTELESQRIALRRRLSELDAVKTTCMNCEHFGSDKLCAVFQEIPPAEAMTTDIDCPSWKYDEIPF